MSQEIKEISLADLVLWTENPRDPIDPRRSDQDVVDRAITDSGSKWNLRKLAREMGNHYDLSELPTVVFHGRKPVVYDGNRRIVLGKIKHGFVVVDDFDEKISDFPAQIPCNVCTKSVALQNVYRKQADTGSWLPLERDVFLDKHMGKGKSSFLLMEENTGLITANPHLNQRFVKEEIFRDDILDRLGFSFKDGHLFSRHSAVESRAVLHDLSQKIKDKQISTRRNRGKVFETLDPEQQRVIDGHAGNKLQPVDLRESIDDSAAEASSQRRSRRTKLNDSMLFGGPLYLTMGIVSNLYRDIVDIHNFYVDNKPTLSDTFPSLIRMALRLLCEAAAKDCSQDLDKYVKTNFVAAKGTLGSDKKTSLSNQNVTETSILQLLHTGAHTYAASANMEQTLAISLIVGAILSTTHSKSVSK